jgi:hypothetical protein
VPPIGWGYEPQHQTLAAAPGVLMVPWLFPWDRRRLSFLPKDDDDKLAATTAKKTIVSGVILIFFIFSCIL